MDCDEPISDISFVAKVIEWRGPSPFYFAAVPEDLVGALRDAARWVSYGWGAIPVEAEIRSTRFRTSLFPKDGGYMLPLKADVRQRNNLGLHDEVQVRLRIWSPV